MQYMPMQWYVIRWKYLLDGSEGSHRHGFTSHYACLREVGTWNLSPYWKYWVDPKYPPVPVTDAELKEAGPFARDGLMIDRTPFKVEP